MTTRQTMRRRTVTPLRTPLPSDAKRRSAAVKPAMVLVGTDGSQVASSAVKWASLMAARGAWEPEALAVLEPVPMAVGEMGIGVTVPDAYATFSDSVITRIRTQLKRHDAAAWPLAVKFGSPAATIARIAKERGATMIVLGLGRHGRLARLVGAETALRVTRLTDVPVLAVEGGIRHLPRRAVVAMDFGESSIRAAREALDLLEGPGRLHLLHVRWALNGKPLYDATTEQTYAAGVEDSFARLIDSLPPRDGIKVTSEMRFGGVIETTLSVADRMHADLVVAGSHSQNVVDRLLIGSTPAQLLRLAKCSVLVVPPI